jgi:hypothetical protein
MTFLFSFLVSFPVSTQTDALRQNDQTANRSLSLPIKGKRKSSSVARSLFVDAGSMIRRRRGVVQPKQSAEQLDLQKNVLLNGVDSSTENTTFFNAIFQKN